MVPSEKYHHIFIAGGTGFIGKQLIPMLTQRGHTVRALVRPGSDDKLPAGCIRVLGDALQGVTFSNQIQPADTFIQLIGTPHPTPAKEAEYRAIDGVSVRESVHAAVEAKVRHFIYISVAQPAPIMRAYIDVRAQGEALIRKSGMNGTIFRPWYVLGPDRWWPALFIPIYWLCEWLPATREGAQRLGLLNWREMINALVAAVEDPPLGFRIWDVPHIRHFQSRST